MRCETTILLFYRYPRPIHVMYTHDTVKKVIARNPTEFFNIIEKYNSIAELHTPLHITDEELNKIVFDVDGKNIYESFNETCKLVDALKSEDIPYIPVYTGGSGFHIYVPVVPFEANAETVRLAMKSFQDYYIDKARLRCYDKRFIGSPTHTIRIPLTRRFLMFHLLFEVFPKVVYRWCVYLPENFCDLEPDKILRISQNPACRIYEFKDLPDVREYLGVVKSSELRGEPLEIENLPVSLALISKLVRPCVFKQVYVPDAPHDARTYFVTELAWLGFDEETIIRYCSLMGWEDFDPHITSYHVKRICLKVRNKALYPPSCSTLKIKGYCLGEACPYYPSYFYWWGVL